MELKRKSLQKLGLQNQSKDLRCGGSVAIPIELWTIALSEG